jgi:hypothetical protein
MPRGPKIDKNIERLIIRIHEENPDLIAKEVQAELWETKEWKIIPPKSYPENWPGVDAIQKIIKEARDRKIRIGPDTKDRPWSLVSISRYPISPEALPFILRVWARSIEINNPLTINQALWVSRIYTLFKAKALGDSNHSLTSMLNNLKNIDRLRAVVNTLALNEKVFFNDYPNDDYPSNEDDILYYWMCDAELYSILPEGEPSAKNLVTKFYQEFSSKYIPEKKSNSKRDALIKKLAKNTNEGGIQ